MKRPRRSRRTAIIFCRGRCRGHSAHIGSEVVHYRWHPLHGRRLRRHYMEIRGGGEVVQLEVSPGVITMVAGWMLDATACGCMGFGAPRVAVAALRDLHHLLTALGFGRSFATDIAQESRHEAITPSTNAWPAPAEPADRADEGRGPEPCRTARGRRAARNAPDRGGRSREAGGDR